MGGGVLYSYTPPRYLFVSGKKRGTNEYLPATTPLCFGHGCLAFSSGASFPVNHASMDGDSGPEVFLQNKRMPRKETRVGPSSGYAVIKVRKKMRQGDPINVACRAMNIVQMFYFVKNKFLTHLIVCSYQPKYRLIAAAALRPATMAVTTRCGPVRISPPVKTPRRCVAPVFASAINKPEECV